jgi:hypothetical protein
MLGSSWEVMAGMDGRLDDGGSWLGASFTAPLCKKEAVR